MATCSYCKPNQDRKRYLLTAWDVQMYIDVERKQLRVRATPGRGREKSIDITHCPKCGRPL